MFGDYVDEGDLRPHTQDVYRYEWTRPLEGTLSRRDAAELMLTDVRHWPSYLSPAARQHEQAERLLRAVRSNANV